MSSYQIQCGRRFREERERLGLTQAEIHRATGIGKHTIVAYEAGDSILYIRQKDIFDSLGFNLPYIYFGIDPYDVFDAAYQIILHMQEIDRGVDREAAVEIMKVVLGAPEQDISATGRTLRAALSLVPRK